MTSDSAKFGVLAGAGRDVDLVHAAKNGDTSAFDHLVGRYDHNLLRIAQHVTHNREDAQDAVQEAFMNAFQHLDQFREDAQFSTWLIRITVNQSLMKLRKQRSVREISLDEDFQTERDLLPIEVADWAPNPEELYRSSELRDILTKTLEHLQPILRTVFVLRDVEGLSIAQAADVLDLTQTAVKARLWRARLQLREWLTRYFRKQSESVSVEIASGRPNLARPRTEECISV